MAREDLWVAKLIWFRRPYSSSLGVTSSTIVHHRRNSCRTCSIVCNRYCGYNRHLFGIILIGKTLPFHWRYCRSNQVIISLRSPSGVADETVKLRVWAIRFPKHLLIQHNIYSRELLEKRQTHFSTVNWTTLATTPNRHVITS